MPTNKEYIDQYEAQLLVLANAIKDARQNLDAKTADIAALDETIDTAENSIMLDVLEARYDVEGFPEYNKLRYTNAEQRKAAQKLAQEADADFQALVNQRKLYFAESKAFERQIEFDRKQFRAAELAMQFYSTNP